MKCPGRLCLENPTSRKKETFHSDNRSWYSCLASGQRPYQHEDDPETIRLKDRHCCLCRDGVEYWYSICLSPLPKSDTAQRGEPRPSTCHLTSPDPVGPQSSPPGVYRDNTEAGWWTISPRMLTTTCSLPKDIALLEILTYPPKATLKRRQSPFAQKPSCRLLYRTPPPLSSVYPES